jgi:hypothetical protein
VTLSDSNLILYILLPLIGAAMVLLAGWHVRLLSYLIREVHNINVMLSAQKARLDSLESCTNRRMPPPTNIEVRPHV